MKIAFVLLMGCATSIETTWQSPDLKPKHISTFAVFGSSRTTTGRAAFENALSSGLRARGLNARPGYEFVKPDENLTKDDIIARLRKTNVEGVLITRVIDSETQVRTTPVAPMYGGGRWANPYAGGWYGYWAQPYPMPMAEQVTETTTYYIETVLYGVDDNEPLWGARSETTRTKPESFARDITGHIARELNRVGFVKK